MKVPLYFSLQDICGLLRVGESYVRSKLKAGDWPHAVNLGSPGRCADWRIPDTDLLPWLEARQELLVAQQAAARSAERQIARPFFSEISTGIAARSEGELRRKAE